MAGLVLASPNSVSVPIELTEEAFYMRPLWLGLSFALILSGLTVVKAGGHGCAKCGCSECESCCKLVCDIKKVKTTKYRCECEDFCVPHEGCHDRVAPQTCDCDNNCNDSWFSGICKLFSHDKSTAGCADVKTKKKLVKYEETKEVPVYKWVTETRCPHCGHCTQCESPAPAPAAAPKPPAGVPTAVIVAPVADDLPVAPSPPALIPASFR